MHAANTRLNRVAHMVCAGISAADHLLRGGLLRCAADAVTVWCRWDPLYSLRKKQVSPMRCRTKYHQ